jgi:hypothetical protein
MGEAVQVSAPRAGPAAGFRIFTLGMSYFIYDAAFDATSRFAADKFFFLYDLHRILSVEKPFIIAEFRSRSLRYDVVMDERDFYTERPESKLADYTCPRCKRSNQYQVRWVRRTKKDRLPPRADERDRALYAKLRDYLVRVDDDVTCKTCQKRFEIPSHQTMVFLDEHSSKSPQGNEDDDNRGNR